MSKIHVRNYVRARLGGKAPLGPNETGAWTMPNPVNEQASPYVVYHLRCMKTGGVHVFVDDGAGREGYPLNGRQSLIRALTKQVAPGIPLFFTDDPLPVPFNVVDKSTVPANMKLDGEKGIYDDMLANEVAQREASAEMARLEASQRESAMAQAHELARNAKPVVAAAMGALPDAAKLKAENDALKKQLADAQAKAAPKLDDKPKPADDKTAAKGK